MTVVVVVVVVVVVGASRDYNDHAHVSRDESSDSVLGIVRICSGLSYETLKTGLIHYHCTRMGYSDCRSHSQSTFQYSRSTNSSRKSVVIIHWCIFFDSADALCK